MTDLKTTVVFADETRDVIFRTGEAAKIYDPVPLKISGQIDAPLRFYLSRKDLKVKNESGSELPYFPLNETIVIVDRERMTIKLICNEKSVFRDEITGSLEIAPIFGKLGINTGATFTPNELGNLLRKHQYLFTDRQEAATTISALLKFTADINTTIEQEKRAESGGQRKVLDVDVKSNAPKSFRLNLSLFKGDVAAATAVSIVYDTSGHSVICSLESLEAIDLIEQKKNERISENIADFESDGISVIEI